MAKVTKSQLTSMKREEVLALLSDFFESQDEEVMRESGNAIVFPSVDAEGNELYVKVTVSIPRGDRSGEAYNGHEVASAFKEHCEEVAANKAQREKEKAEAAKKRKEKAAAAKAKKEAEAKAKAEKKAAQEQEEAEE